MRNDVLQKREMDSAIAGTSGSSGARAALVTANARSFPDFTWMSVDAIVPK